MSLPQFFILAYVLTMLAGLGVGAILDALNITLDRQPIGSWTEAILAPIGYVVFAPLVETWLMIPIFAALRCLSTARAYLVIGSSLVWALLHAVFDWAWAFPVFAMFLVLSFSFLHWEEELGRRRAFWLTVFLHALVNTWPTVWMVAEFINR
jgi:hypothetical protein